MTEENRQIDDLVWITFVHRFLIRNKITYMKIQFDGGGDSGQHEIVEMVQNGIRYRNSSIPSFGSMQYIATSRQSFTTIRSWHGFAEFILYSFLNRGWENGNTTTGEFTIEGNVLKGHATYYEYDDYDSDNDDDFIESPAHQDTWEIELEGAIWKDE